MMNNISGVPLSQNLSLQSTENYDTLGAIVFIVFVLCWYSLSVVFLLGIQMMKHQEILQDSMRYSKGAFTRQSHEKHGNKRILGKSMRIDRSNEIIFFYSRRTSR